MQPLPIHTHTTERYETVRPSLPALSYEVFTVNVKAPYLLVAALAPSMAERGHGAIINVTTMVSEFGMNGMGLYGSSKAALMLLTKSWAAEFGPAGVRVNAVSPGPTRTEDTLPMGDALDQLAQGAPAGRVGRPEELAAAIAFLATEAASFIHGALLRRRLRRAPGRSEEPSAVAVDSQMVKAAANAQAETVGYDGNKKIKGR